MGSEPSSAALHHGALLLASATPHRSVLPLGLQATGPVGLALDTNTCTNAECWKQRNMTLLKQALLTGYDMTVQPPRFGSERGALVSVQLAMQQFQKLDTTNQEINSSPGGGTRGRILD